MPVLIEVPRTPASPPRDAEAAAIDAAAGAETDPALHQPVVVVTADGLRDALEHDFHWFVVRARELVPDDEARRTYWLNLLGFYDPAAVPSGVAATVLRFAEPAAAPVAPRAPAAPAPLPRIRTLTPAEAQAIPDEPEAAPLYQEMATRFQAYYPASALPSARYLARDLEALAALFGEVHLGVIEGELESAGVKLWVVTPPISLAQRPGDELIPLGRFRLELRTTFLIAREYNAGLAAVALEPNPPHGRANYSDVTHPHVRRGVPCLGATASLFRSRIVQGRVFDVFDMLYRLLSTYNDVSPFVHLRDWVVPATACVECGALSTDDDVEMVRCEAGPCGAWVCGECVHSCVNCGEGNYCPQHDAPRSCENCEAGLCHRCACSDPRDEDVDLCGSCRDNVQEDLDAEEREREAEEHDDDSDDEEEDVVNGPDLFSAFPSAFPPTMPATIVGDEGTRTDEPSAAAPAASVLDGILNGEGVPSDVVTALDRDLLRDLGAGGVYSAMAACGVASAEAVARITSTDDVPSASAPAVSAEDVPADIMAEYLRGLGIRYDAFVGDLADAAAARNAAYTAVAASASWVPVSSEAPVPPTEEEAPRVP